MGSSTSHFSSEELATDLERLKSIIESGTAVIRKKILLLPLLLSLLLPVLVASSSAFTYGLEIQRNPAFQ